MLAQLHDRMLQVQQPHSAKDAFPAVRRGAGTGCRASGLFGGTFAQPGHSVLDTTAGASKQ